MKIGVISDIHSNIIAFREALNYLEKEGCDEYLFLGDYVSDTPYTRQTLDLLYEFMNSHICYLLRGNREEYMLAQREVISKDRIKDKWIWNSASGNLLFAYEQLNDDDFDFFEKLPISFKYIKEGYPAITCCHGSPVNSRELLQLDGENTKDILHKIDTDYLICAHTHFPGEMSLDGRHYYNCGCVGISIGDYGFAQCMILEDVENNGRIEWKPTFLKIPYDNKRVVRDIVDSGMLNKAGWFANSNIQILLTGIDNAATMVELAKKLALEENENSIWPNIDEIFFEKAAKSLGIPDYREEILD